MVSGECCHSLSLRWQALVSFSATIFALLRQVVAATRNRQKSKTCQTIWEKHRCWWFIRMLPNKLIINLGKQLICQRIFPKLSFPFTQGSTKLPGICPGILPLFLLFPSIFKPVLHRTTSKSLSNYPVIHSKPYSPLLFPLMTSIKSNCETTGWTPKPIFFFHSVGVHQLVDVMWRNYYRTSSDLLSFLACGTTKLLCYSFTTRPPAHDI